ncbi:hypothetical protein HJG60_009181 [Phyllostomus discolor]|uniref:Uncharacterized protein n=1 Tax=Phyllostomus discolor TaxID=89673 RepID=A0A833YFN2_9CHIR|nr:hypothetical protein HJG60_009181 [Phyllostomus discolor]
MWAAPRVWTGLLVAPLGEQDTCFLVGLCLERVPRGGCWVPSMPHPQPPPTLGWPPTRWAPGAWRCESPMGSFLAHWAGEPAGEHAGGGHRCREPQPTLPTYLLIGCLAVSCLLVSMSSLLGTVVTLLLEVGTLATQAAMAQQLASVLNLLTCGSWVSGLCFLAAIVVDLDLCVDLDLLCALVPQHRDAAPGVTRPSGWPVSSPAPSSSPPVPTRPSCWVSSASPWPCWCSHTAPPAAWQAVPGPPGLWPPGLSHVHHPAEQLPPLLGPLLPAPFAHCPVSSTPHLPLCLQELAPLSGPCHLSARSSWTLVHAFHSQQLWKTL